MASPVAGDPRDPGPLCSCPGALAALKAPRVWAFLCATCGRLRYSEVLPGGTCC